MATSTGRGLGGEDGDTELGQPGPQPEARLVIAGGPGPVDGRSVGSGQQVVEGPGEPGLLGGQLELHPGARLLWEAEDPFGDDVALDLVGARIDRPDSENR